MLASLAAAACLATGVHTAPLPQSGALSHLRWVQAMPRRAGIVGMLFSYDARLESPGAPTFALWSGGAAPGGSPAMKVLWLVRNVYASRSLVVAGRRLDGPGRFRKAFDSVADASAEPASGVEFASIVDIPTAGCWRLDVSAGKRVRGSFVVRAVSP